MNRDQDQSLVESSYARCRSHAGFMDIFYDAFINSAPSVKAKFEGVDMVNQKKMIRHSVLGLILAHKNPLRRGPESVLKDVAKTHGRKGHKVTDDEYDHWKQTLLSAVKKCDPECEDEILHAWSEVVDSGIDYLKHNR